MLAESKNDNGGICKSITCQTCQKNDFQKVFLQALLNLILYTSLFSLDSIQSIITQKLFLWIIRINIPEICIYKIKHATHHISRTNDKPKSSMQNYIENKALRDSLGKNSFNPFSAKFYFYTPWKRQKTKIFLTFPEGIEIECWAKMGFKTWSCDCIHKTNQPTTKRSRLFKANIKKAHKTLLWCLFC